MTRAASRAPADRPTATDGQRPRNAAAVSAKGFEGYFKRSELPLHSLAFLFPLMVAYEIGLTFHTSEPLAFRLMQNFFARVGATGRFIPALSVAGILLAWHIARNDVWKVRLSTLGGMAIESFLLALPLVALGVAVARWQIRMPLYAEHGSWGKLRDLTVLSLGAGIYEELVFRLALLTLLSLLLLDVLKLPQFWGGLLMVLISAVLFSLYHYLGSEPFEIRSFLFRSIAGIYFGLLFFTRGFGITAGSHAFYDVVIVLMRILR